MRPTPNPAKNRPARNRGRATAAVWRMTPKINTTVEAIRASRRPILSARKGDVRAPKKVPAERILTMAESWEGEMPGSLVVGLM